VLTAPDERTVAHRLYRDKVDHTYDVARIDAGPETASQDPPPQEAGGEGATRDVEPDADAEAHQTDETDAADRGTQQRDGEASGAEAQKAKDIGGREAWAEALPGLRTEWEEHEREFPEPSRSAAGNQADGSWLGDGGRRLTPEQNTDASKACEDIRAEGKEVIRPAIERVEAADPERRLAGLEHMLKGEDRLKEKMADYLRAPGTTVPEALDTVPDAVRFTLTYESERYAEGVLSDVDRIKSEGFELIKLKNLWAGEQYKGINSQWRRAETGLRFEMQFHTPESLEAKELTHRAYERIRSRSSPAERSELEDFQRRVNERLRTPPRTDEIRDFPEKRQ
jgi:hypothetical protein